MVRSNNKLVAAYEDSELFRESILYTAKITGFNSTLIEKDYFCSLLLHYLYVDEDCKLVFKGGTCLSKIHADFYRLSEDLDFIIPVSSDSSRSERSKLAKPLKGKIELLPKEFQIFEVPDSLKGHNNSKQYIAYVQYTSFITSKPETVKIEIGLREELLTDSLSVNAKTLLMNPFSGQVVMQPVKVYCISLKEAYSEKVRAALTRREPAIRDFYDIDFAIQNIDFDLGDSQFLELVSKKLAIPGNESIDVSESRKEMLRKQIETELKTVLKPKDFENFDLDRAFGTVVNLSIHVQI